MVYLLFLIVLSCLDEILSFDSLIAVLITSKIDNFKFFSWLLFYFTEDSEHKEGSEWAIICMGDDARIA